MKNYIVYWKSTITGLVSHGICLTEKHVDTAVRLGNSKFPHINHWKVNAND
jgi:hypothetical protein